MRVMEGNISNEFVDDVRSHFDIVQLISEYMPLKKSGRNYFGLCPFHGEKTPSFSVSQDKQIFHCFGCGEGGNVFSFIMKMDGLTFPEAVKDLARRGGLTLPQASQSPGAVRDELTNKRLREAMQWAAKYYQHLLGKPQSLAASQYLEKRGLTPEVIAQFGIGFSNDRWDDVKKLLIKRSYTERELVLAGLLTENEQKMYDRFRNRIMFPIHNQRGEIIAFGGRAIGDALPKYLNSPETPLFEKGKTLYALHLARESIRREKQVIIFEGYMDVIAAHQAGISHAVASLGTSLTEAQARLLRNHAEEVVMIYDADAAGQAATWRGLQILRQAGCLVKVGRLPKNLDPDDFIRRFGGEVFRRDIVGKALLLVDYQLATLADQYDIKKDDDRIRLFDKVCEALIAVENAMEREDYLVKAAAMLKVPADSIREELRKKRQPAAVSRKPLQQSGHREQEQRANTAEKASWQVLTLWARFPALIPPSVNEVMAEDFPPQLVAGYLEAKNRQASFSPSRLLDLLSEEKHRQILSRLLIQEEYEEKIAKKAIDDCIRLLKCVRIASHRKEIELQMAKLDPAASKGEIDELSIKWLELRKLEEATNNPREGGKGVV